MEWNDIYDKNGNRTGRVHLRGTPWRKGDFGLVVCVWVYDGEGKILLTRRAPGKSFAGTWENSGGAAKAGESSREAIVRELYEETGIRASQEEFQMLGTGRDNTMLYDYYALKKKIPIENIVLQPGETDGVRWATIDEVGDLIEKGEMCRVIAKEFRKNEKYLREKSGQA